DTRELAGAQDLHRGVRRGSLRSLSGRHRRNCTLAEASVALVARDGEEPGERLTQHGAVQERAVRGQEDLLRRVLGLDTVTQERATERAHRVAVLAVELLSVVRAAVGLSCR